MKRTLRRITGVVAVLLMSSAMASADVVLDWNAVMLNTIGGENPFAQARFAAITQTAVFEAVNAITGDYEPYFGTITAPRGASAEAAAVAAAHGVLKNYFPSSAANLDLARANSLATIPNGQAKDEGIAVGEAAAAAMIANRANDGSAPPQLYTPPSANPGEWQTTPGCPPAGGILLHWRNVTPFGIESSDQFRSDPPPAFTSNKYSKAYNEVKEVGELNSPTRPQDRTDVARYFAVSAPVHVWSQAMSQASVAQGKSLSENARAFALLTMAISDASISTFETKYHYVFWRPYTAIRAGDTDGNRKTDPDAAWTPFIPTPCFPSYPSAHATASNAGRTIAENIFGRGGHDITLSHPAIPAVTLNYTKFSQITRDIDDARVYGGIHFRFDQEAGARQGRQVGTYIYKNNLRRCGNHDKHCSAED
jgi:PAP2 superfamily